MILHCTRYPHIIHIDIIHTYNISWILFAVKWMVLTINNEHFYSVFKIIKYI